jgi:Raf kinase inhibitor-like YbhB/YbcL family protein
MPLMLASPAFASGGQIPTEYTCVGANISPPLSWSGVPPGTGSLVLVVEDPDAPSGVFRHWAVFDISPRTAGLAPGYGRNRPVTGFREARNDFGDRDYGGPCPPPGSGTHRYDFRLLAISRPTLELAAAATVADVLQAAQSYIIAQTQLTGTYQR